MINDSRSTLEPPPPPYPHPQNALSNGETSTQIITTMEHSETSSENVQVQKPTWAQITSNTMLHETKTLDLLSKETFEQKVVEHHCC